MATESHEERFLAAIRKSLTLLEGTYGIAALCLDCPDLLIGARKGSPLIIGVGRNEHLIASDVNAITHCTENVVYLNDNEIVSIDRDDFSISTLSSKDVTAVVEQVSWDTRAAEIGEYPHFMLKEIFEQASALQNGMRGRFSDDESSAFLGGSTSQPGSSARLIAFYLSPVGLLGTPASLRNI